MMKGYLVALALVLASASQVLAQPPIIILPGLLDSRLLVSYSQATDSSSPKGCNNNINTQAMWVPSLQNETEITRFIDTFAPAVPAPTCWYHTMQLRKLPDNRFTSNTGVTVTPSLSISQSYILPTFRAMLLNKTGLNYDPKRIRVLPYDWRLDVNSMNRTGQLAVLRARIQAVVKQFNETVILVGYSQGNLVALGLLKDPKVRVLVRAYIAVAPPFGGSTGVLGALSSGAVAGNVPPNMLKALKIPAPYDAFIKFEDLMYNAAKNLASLAMLAPSAAGYPGDPVIAVANGTQYKVSQITQLLNTIGQRELSAALSSQVQATDLTPIEGVPTYCIYGTSLKTITALGYNATLATSRNELPYAAATAPGDSVVPLSSLSLCDKLTDGSTVYKLTGPIGHFNIFAVPAGRAALFKAISTILDTR